MKKHIPEFVYFGMTMVFAILFVVVPDGFREIPLFVGFVWFLFGMIYMGDFVWDQRQYEKDVAAGNIKIISEAEYKRSFGIKPKLKEVKND